MVYWKYVSVCISVLFLSIFGLGWSIAPVHAVALTRNVYVQNPTDTTIEIDWKTDTGGASKVNFGPTAAYGTTATGDAGRKNIYASPGFFHHVKITGLTPNTQYYYQIMVDATTLSPAGDQTFTFKTAPTKGASTPFTFAFWGDSGDGGTSQRNVATQVHTKKPDLVMVAGDVVYPYGGGSATAEGKQDPWYFDTYAATMKFAPFYATCGNHDDSACHELVDDHSLPGGGKAGGGVLSTYAFDYGNVHFTTINSNDNVSYNSAAPASSAPQMAWAYNDIKNSPQPWKVFYFHHNLWSAGSHSTLQNMVDNVGKLAQDAGADVVFWGHSHVMERFSAYPAAGGPVYYTVGNGGKKTTVSSCGQYPNGPSCLYGSKGEAGFLFAQVNGNSMKIDYITETGQNPDTATYTTTGGPPVPTATPGGYTPTPTMGQPTSTPGGPTLTPVPGCPKKTIGDADCDGQIKLADIDIWRREFYGEITTKLADFNADSKISLLDHSAWRQTFFDTQGGAIPTATPAGPSPTPSTQPATISPTPVGPSPTPTATGRPTGCSYPAQKLHLTNWKETLPTGSSGSPTEIKQPQLATYTNDPFFKVNAACTGVQFRSPTNGVTTSGSSYPRSELREMTSDGSNGASWSSSSGTHTMFIDQAITAVPEGKRHVVAGQVHDSSDDVIVIRLEYPTLSINVAGADGPVLDPNYTLGKRFTVKFVVSGGKTDIYYNGSTSSSYTLNRSFSGAYFKAGAYTQSNCSTESSAGKTCGANNYGEVHIYDLQVTHQ